MPSDVQGAPAPERVAAVRRFNRFYTRRIGVLDEGHLRSSYSLGEVRVLYELARWHDADGGEPTATELARELALDPGYLSRMLRGFEQRGLLARSPSPTDGRQSNLRLTPAGQAAFAELDTRARDDVAATLSALGDADQQRLLEAMRIVESVLSRPLAGDGRSRPYVLRPPHAGDFGWVVARHGALYAAAYGWDDRFEALVARIVSDFVDHQDPKRERCWIAECEGVNVGSIFLVKDPERPGVAKLRLLLVEPSARGVGIGRRLVDECTRFARQAGYHTITLWTNSVLTSARRIYEAAGYRLVHEAPHHSFGHDLVGQTWELAL